MYRNGHGLPTTSVTPSTRSRWSSPAGGRIPCTNCQLVSLIKEPGTFFQSLLNEPPMQLRQRGMHSSPVDLTAEYVITYERQARIVVPVSATAASAGLNVIKWYTGTLLMKAYVVGRSLHCRFTPCPVYNLLASSEDGGIAPDAATLPAPLMMIWG